MIDSIVKLLDRLIQWKTYRDRRRRDAFKELFEPLFAELQEIHTNYGAIFQDAQKRLNPKDISADFAAAPTRMRETVEMLKSRRQELEHLRMKVLAMAKKLCEVDWSGQENVFIESLIEYFASGLEPVPRIIGSTKLREVMEALENAGVRSEDVWAAVELVENAVFYQRERWEDVCSAFAELKTAIYMKT